MMNSHGTTPGHAGVQIFRDAAPVRLMALRLSEGAIAPFISA